MSQTSPFDHRPDPALGNLLRTALAGEGEEAFVRRVLTAAAGQAVGTSPEAWWQVLGTWARPGLAAALTLAASATIWLVNASTPGDVEPTLEGVYRATAEAAVPAVLIASTTPPSFDRVLASTLEP